MTVGALGNPIAADRFDRAFFLILLTIIWAGVVAGFLPEMINRTAGDVIPFAPIVHIHAAAYSGWLILLAVQMGLVRIGRTDIHRRLGRIGIVLIPIMAVLGPWTGIVMGRREVGTPHGDPAILIEIFFDALNFLVVAGLALAMRRDGFAHKRLMLTATIFIAVAGFGRWLGPPVEKAMGEGPLSYFLQNYSLGAVLILALVLYDLATRRRLHRIVVLATLFGLFNQIVVSFVHEMPEWQAFCVRFLSS